MCGIICKIPIYCKKKKKKKGTSISYFFLNRLKERNSLFSLSKSFIKKILHYTIYNKKKTMVLSIANFLLNHMDWVKIFVGISSPSEDLSLNFPQFWKISVQNLLKCDATFESPYWSNIHILSAPYLLYWSMNNVYHGAIFKGSNILFIHTIFSLWQKYSICVILSPPSSYWPIITFHLILAGFPLHKNE